MKLNGVGDTLSGPHGYEIFKYPIRYFNKGILIDIVTQSLSAPNEGYLPFLLQKEGIVYCEIGYRGLVVVIPSPEWNVLPHVKTVAVMPPHQKNGVGSDLIHVVSEEFPKFNLRSKRAEERKIANNMYRKLLGKPEEFVNKNGTPYYAYFKDHSREEKKSALEWMVQQPDAF